MSELKDSFQKLSDLYKDNTLTWVEISDLYDKANEASKSDASEGENIYSLRLIKSALRDWGSHLSAMAEVCTTIRGLCGESGSSGTTFYDTHESWKEILEAAGCESYLAYIYALAGLANLNPACSNHTKLALAAVSTYMLSLTIPGAKGFHVFDEEIIAHCMHIFTLTERIQNPDIERRMTKNQSVEIWVHLTTLCDDLKLLLRYVHFKDNKIARDDLLKKLIKVLLLNHERGYANIYAANLHRNIFEVFDELINAHNGEPEETLTKLINMTAILHIYPPKPKSVTGGMSSATSETSCEHISDWFISRIDKYPQLLVQVLNLYIECVVVTPIKTWKTEQIQRGLEYAAKYDAALFTKCNQTCTELLYETICAEEVMVRARTIELIARILQLQSQVNWLIFRHEVSDIPREVDFIKILIEQLCDNNNTIKLKAVQSLQTVLSKGSMKAQKIMTEGILSARFTDCDVVLPEEPIVSRNEIRFEKPEAPTPKYTFNGHGVIEMSFLNLPSNVYENIFESSVSNLRRAGIAFMEQLIMINPLIIFETKFVSHIKRFEHEPTALVRKQAMQTVDTLLGRFPCYPIIWVWCKILIPMLKDEDPKNTEIAINCFHSRVLLNMRTLDNCKDVIHFMPWVIIRTMLSTDSRLYLQVSFHLALKQSLVNSQMLSIIESHLSTSNSTDAWIVLNFVAGKIKSKQPDALIEKFISQSSWNAEFNTSIALEVLSNCIDHCSHSALNVAFNNIFLTIRNGKMLPVHINKAFDFLVLISQKSEMQSQNKQMNPTNKITSTNKVWINELHTELERCILSGINEFPRNRDTLISHLWSYTEANVMLRHLRPNITIVSFIHKYMSECLKVNEGELDAENKRFINLMIVTAGRLSLRDVNVASTTCNLYDSILRTMDHPAIVNSIILSITDICKKHTHIVERIIDRMLSKLTSPFSINRRETFKCFQTLVLQDQLKLRDTLLLSLLTTLLDEDEELVLLATNFFEEYTSKKNTTLYHRCLMEYPFVLNEYKNFKCKDSFSEKVIKSAMKGDAQLKRRQSLYNYFMAKMDEINLILYFNQLKFLAEKCKCDSLMKTAEGVAVLRDVFFILKRVCQLTKEKKSTGDNKGEADDKADVLDDDLVEPSGPAATNTSAATSATNTNAAANAGSGVGRGRGRRREIITLEDALLTLEKSLIFIPNIFKLMISVDSSLQKTFDELGFALAERFYSYICDAQPADFWRKYYKKIDQQNKKNLRGKKRKSDSQRVESGSSTENDDNDDDKYSISNHDEYSMFAKNLRDPNGKQNLTDSDSDDLPLTRERDQVSPAKRMRTQHPTTSMEYIFNPNI